MSFIRSSDVASTRVKAGDGAGVETVEPDALGWFHSAWSSTRLTDATSTPALASNDGVMPRSWRSSATARCTGSIWGLPSVTARVPAALITSTLREVSFDASTWFSSRGGPGVGLDCAGSVYPNEAKVESIPLNFDEFSWPRPRARPVDHGSPSGQSADTG